MPKLRSAACMTRSIAPPPPAWSKKRASASGSTEPGRFQCRPFQQRQLAADALQALPQVVLELAARRPAEVLAHHDALVQRGMHGHSQASLQFGQPDQQQAQAQVLEQFGAQVLGFVKQQVRPVRLSKR